MRHTSGQTTERLEKQLTADWGTGTGETRYRQFREIARALDLPLSADSSGRLVTEETIEIARKLKEEDWEEGLKECRNQTNGLVKLSEKGLLQIRESLENLTP